MNNPSAAGLEYPSTDGRLIYAVGDVHGRSDLLTPLVRSILADALALRPDQQPMLVLLGDYIDRGDDSRGVIDLILRLQADQALEVKALRGNHEDGLLTFLVDPSFGPTWVRYGGGATLASYGVAFPASGGQPEEWAAASQALGAQLPPEHRAFYQSLPHALVVGGYVFVHAGLRPGVSIADQRAEDLLWIRDEFFDAKDPFEKVVVHGHTPAREPQILPYRIGIDTGAYASGVLTAVRLDAHGQTLIQVSDRPYQPAVQE